MAIAHRRALRSEHQLVIEGLYAEAEEVTRGRLLNARGERQGIDPLSLFMGNETRALAYASEELVEFWARRPRLPFSEYERQRSSEQEDYS